jgi:hypothetical protein
MASPRLEESADRGDVMLPAVDLVAQMAATFGRERVVPRAAIVVRHAPLGVDGA